MFDLVKVFTNAFLEMRLSIWVGDAPERTRTSSPMTRCVFGSIPRLFRYTASEKKGRQRPDPYGRVRHSLTKDEVVHDIGYDDLQFRLLDGVEGEQGFRKRLGEQWFELGFEFVE